MQTYRKISVTAALAVTLAIAGSIHAADVAGKWKSDFETQIGQLKYVYDLKVDGTNVTGKAIRTLDGATTESARTDGKLTGDSIAFAETLNTQDQDIRIDYSGKVSGDEMKLTRKVGDFGTTEIVAKRDKDAAPKTDASIVGKWKSDFDSQIGKQSYIYEFKLEDGKLTGTAKGDIAGQKSDTKITDGKLDGADISFVENVKFNDQEVRVDYKGKFAGDEIKLTRKVGDFATEEIVAKRMKE
jgi:hypothetical protein